LLRINSNKRKGDDYGTACFEVFFNGGKRRKYYKGSKFVTYHPAHTFQAVDAVRGGTWH